MTRRAITRAVLAFAVGYVLLSYAWIHAALAAVAGPSACSAHLVDQALADVAALYGEARACPFVACLDAPRAGLAVSHGTTSFAVGLPSIVLLGPQGTNRDVAAHEVAHAEFAARAGVLLRTVRVPVWFDEGLAMQVDHRAAYGRDALESYLAAGERPSLAALASRSGFFRSGRTGRANYAFARCAVAGWLDERGRDGLLTLIDRLGWTAPFPVAPFAPHARACRGGSVRGR